jgi:hypothetical protein
MSPVVGSSSELTLTKRAAGEGGGSSAEPTAHRSPCARPNKRERASAVHGEHILVVDASMSRNEFAFMNDYRWAPLASAARDARGSRGGGEETEGPRQQQLPWRRAPNVDTYTVMRRFGDGEGVCVWPAIVVRATRDIAEGEELLWDYGPLYWELLQKGEAVRSAAKQNAPAAASAAFFAQRRGRPIEQELEVEHHRLR